MSDVLPLNIGQGELARLMPVGSDSNKEGRATSSLLSIFMAVPDYAKQMLSVAGCKVNTRSKIECFTEIVFLDKNGKKVGVKDSDRPDGIIVVTSGKQVWSALIESKIAKAELDAEQIERYLDLARAQSIDAVITISNQYSHIPTHHPVKVNGQKTRSVGLYHWSWKRLLTEASLYTDDKKEIKDIVDDTQRYLLNEFKRFLEHDSSGVTSHTQMNKSWSAICCEGGLEKKSGDTLNAVTSWHSLCRDLSLNLSEKIGVDVSQNIPRKYLADKNGYNELLKSDVDDLLKDGCVSTQYVVKGAASNITLSANLQEKYISVSMCLKAPKDSKTAQGAIGWVTKQLKGVELDNVHVKACYAGRNSNRTASLQDLLEDGYQAINESNKNIPHSFEIYLKQDLKMSELKGVRRFVDTVKQSVFEYYSHVGENLKMAQDKAPRISRDRNTDIEADVQETDEKLVVNG